MRIIPSHPFEDSLMMTFFQEQTEKPAPVKANIGLIPFFFRFD
jgi:hypothetical protein